MSTRARPRTTPPAPVPQDGPARGAPTRRARATTVSARRRRRLLVVGLVLALLVLLAYGVSMSPLLSVDTVQVRGTSRLTASQVEAAAGVHEGDAITWIDTGKAVAGIEALPYVRDATLHREWPHTIRITVHERTPAAWIDSPGEKALVDGTGRVLEMVDAAPPAMPQLVGAKLVPPPGATIDAVGAARVAGALTGLAAVGTSSVEATHHGIVLHLAAGPEVRMGRPTQIAVKLRAALAVLAAQQGTPVNYVDVSVPTNPVAG